MAVYSSFPRKKRGRLAAFHSLSCIPAPMSWAQTVFSLNEMSCAPNPPPFYSPSQDFVVTDLSYLLNMTKCSFSHNSKLFTLAVSLHCFNLEIM